MCQTRLHVYDISYSAITLQFFFFPLMYYMLDMIASSSAESTKFLLLLWFVVFVLKRGWLQRIRNLSPLTVRFCGQRVKAASLSGYLALKNSVLIGRLHTCMHINREKNKRGKQKWAHEKLIMSQYQLISASIWGVIFTMVFLIGILNSTCNKCKQFFLLFVLDAFINVSKCP